MGILRVFFALSVIASHCRFNYLITSDLAVECFYVISGFYMALVLNEKYISPSDNLLFIKKRFIKLLPPYYFFAIISMGISYCFFSCTEKSPEMLFSFESLPDNMNIFTKIYILFSNLFLIGHDHALFLAINNHTGSLFYSESAFTENHPLIRFYALQVAWSIGLEFLFYIVAPYFLRKGLKIVAIVLLSSLLIKFAIRYYCGLNDGNWTYRCFIAEICCFCFGYISYKLYKYFEHKRLRISKVLIIPLLLIMALFSTLKLPYLISFLTLIPFVIISIPFIFIAFKKNKKDRLVGELSYLMYLSHPIILAIVSITTMTKNSIYLNYFIIVSIISIAISILTYLLIVQPIERFRNNIK